ncbi:MAG: response regulator [Chloroflexi bacterium]|nr:response regulator [Chloroflexota bacterium]
MKKTQVLVTEDSTTIRHCLVYILNADPEIEVVGEATNGREAVEMTTRLAPDIITMDVVMPDMDGLEATGHIMQQTPTPILILSAYANSVDMNVVFEAMKAGALDVMAKPTDLCEITSGDWKEMFLFKVKTLASVSPRAIE